MSKEKAVELNCQYFGETTDKWQVTKEYFSKIESLGWHEVKTQPSRDNLKIPLVILEADSCQRYVTNVLTTKQVSGGFLFRKILNSH